MTRWTAVAYSPECGFQRLLRTGKYLEAARRALSKVRYKKMETDKVSIQIQECLRGLGISSLVDWDVLVFVYRHQAILADADQIARLLCCPGNAVCDTLDNLESLKLIRRSRGSRGVHLYQCVSSEADHASQGCFRQLLALAENRAGRLVLVKKLRQRLGA